MTLELRIEGELYRRLTDHLHHSDVEEVAFLSASSGTQVSIDATELLPLTPDAFVIQTDDHVRLADDTRGRVIRWAHASAAALVEAHVHRSTWPARFSPSDLDGLAEWVPHVRWRLPGRPYIALVFGTDSFDGLVWANADSTPQPLGGLRVSGMLRVPTGITLRPHVISSRGS